MFVHTMIIPIMFFSDASEISEVIIANRSVKEHSRSDHSSVIMFTCAKTLANQSNVVNHSYEIIKMFFIIASIKNLQVPYNKVMNILIKKKNICLNKGNKYT